MGELRALVGDLAEEGRERTEAAEGEASERVSRFHDATDELDAARRKIDALENDREKLPNLAFKANMDEEFEREDELREKYRNTRPALEALRERAGELEEEIAGLVGPNPAIPGGSVYDAMIEGYTRCRDAHRDAAAPLIEIQREVSRILRDAVDPLTDGQRGWGQILVGVRDQRTHDPEVRAHRLEKQAKRAAANPPVFGKSAGNKV
jgi:seryl-tRNA synthetase